MSQENFFGISSADIGTIDRLIDYFENRHLEAFPPGFTFYDPDYAIHLENRRLDIRLRGTIAGLKELREALLSSEQRG